MHNGHFTWLDIDMLTYDITNPRISKYIEHYERPINEEQVLMALNVDEPDILKTGSTSFRSLKESIRTNGGIINPILVNKTNDNEYRVIEGNTRLAIYKRFNNEGAEGDWSKIPAIVYDNLEEKDIDSIRLQAHLVGPRAWDPYSKAKYLYKLRNEIHLTWDQIIDFCGGKKSEAEQLIAAYEDIETYYRVILEDDSQFDASRFSGFVEMQKQNRKKAVAEAGFTLYDVAKWLHSRKIDKLENIRKLPQILHDSKAKEIFLKKNAKEAIKHLEAPTAEGLNLKDASIAELAKALTEKIRNLNYEDLKSLRENKDSDEYLSIFDAQEELNELCEDLS